MSSKERIPVAVIEPVEIIRSGISVCLNSTDRYRVVQEVPGPEAFLAGYDQGTRLVVMGHPQSVHGACGIAYLHGHLPHLRMLGYSSQATPAGMQSAVRSGASGYLPLSAGFSELLNALDDVRIKGQYFHAPFITACLKLPYDEVQAREEPKRALLEVLRLLADLEEYTDQEIADKMGIPLNTVLSHKKKLFAYFKVHTKTAAVLMGIIEGHIPMPERRSN